MPRWADLRNDPAAWVCAFFLLNFAFQRVSALPGLSISASVPLVLIFVALALLTGMAELDGPRTLVWLVAAAASALAAIPQMFGVVGASISFNSWMLWVVSWLPIVMRLRYGPGDFRRTLRGIGWCGVGISALSFLFMAVQFFGAGYQDWFAEIVPDPLQVKGYVITYPIIWSAALNRSNAWLALEPSFLSFTLGIATVATLVARMPVWVTVVTALGLLTSFAGSGVAVVAVAVLLLIVTGRAAVIARHLVVGAALVVVGFFTPLRDVLYQRVFEVGASDSSTSLRTIEPYIQLYPHWIDQSLGTLVGYGAGSSQEVVSGTSIAGLLVPTIAKMVYDYGLIAGGLLLVVVLATFLRTPCPALAWSLLLSTLTIQASSQPLLNAMFAVTAWFAPATSIFPSRSGRRGAEDGAEGSRESAKEPARLNRVSTTRTEPTARIGLPLGQPDRVDCPGGYPCWQRFGIATNVRITFEAARGALQRALVVLPASPHASDRSSFGGIMSTNPARISGLDTALWTAPALAGSPQARLIRAIGWVKR